MPATRPRVFHAAVALCAVAALAASPALATPVEDRNSSTAETPSDAVEAGEGVIAGKWFWGGWWGHHSYYNAYWSYYPYYCDYWNYGYGGYHLAYKSAASGLAETPKKVTAADAEARAAEVRARREGVTETVRGVEASDTTSTSGERRVAPVESRTRERASERASAERANVAAGCGEWLGVTPEQLAGAPANVAVVDDACCWPSGCALAASSECEDDGRACCVPDSKRVEGCE